MQTTDVVSKTTTEQSTITGVKSSDPNFTTDDMVRTSEYHSTDEEVSTVVSTDNGFLDITTIAPVTPRLTKSYRYGNAFGNVNFKTFDGRNFSIDGSDLFVGCKSRFQDVCLNSEFCNFKLFIQLEKNTDVGMSEIVKLKIELKFVKEILETNLGLQVRWITHHGCVSVGLTSSWKNKVDGLLGNFNGEPDDDFADNTGKIQTLNQFVKSFVIKQEGTSDGNFANDHTCRDNATMSSAVYRCSILTDKSEISTANRTVTKDKIHGNAGLFCWTWAAILGEGGIYPPMKMGGGDVIHHIPPPNARDKNIFMPIFMHHLDCTALF
ncbi:putative flocculation protein FLO11 [Apostichopus japonicus]|uniref:Putative flocculation protein FLO11 n=1 Tax=Stichopus japonicus TaxID=307972 RepID=A0A2G8LA88_STIJA|nr:putative flocculation protein FLO11 [Apostichopus japonicus]